MTTQTAEQLSIKHCVSDEGDIKKLSQDEIRELMENVNDWQLADNGRRIRKDWKVKNFQSGMEFLEQVGDVAELEEHHPDVHLEDYKHVWIALSTHSVGGLSENDFIMAAKIDHIADAASIGPWQSQ